MHVTHDFLGYFVFFGLPSYYQGFFRSKFPGKGTAFAGHAAGLHAENGFILMEELIIECFLDLFDFPLDEVNDDKELVLVVERYFFEEDLFVLVFGFGVELNSLILCIQNALLYFVLVLHQADQIGVDYFLIYEDGALLVYFDAA